MNNETPRIRSLLRQADRNLESGKLAAAETMYRQIIEEAPDNPAGWLGLAQVSNNQAEKQAALERVLELDSENTQAQAALSMLHGEDANTLVTETESAQTDFSKVKELNSSEKAEQGANSNVEAPVEKQVHPVEEHDHGMAVAHNPDAEIFCYRHPNRSTSLRCYKCNNPICSECAVKTPVGYLCPTCHREAEDAFYNNKPTDYILAALVALPVSLLAGWLVVRFSGGIFMILLFVFAGGAVGGFIARLSKRAIGKRRGRFIPHVIAACVVIGVLIFAWPWLFVLLSGSAGVLFKLAGIGVYLFTAASSAFYWAR